MAELTTTTTPPSRPGSRLRLAAGLLLAVLALGYGILVVLGVANPWELVVLRLYFGVPTRGFVIFVVLAGTAVWLLTPVRSEADQRMRTTLRAVAVVALVIGLICWGLQPTLFGADVSVLATSADQQRRIALYDYGSDDRDLRVWAGSGWTARDVGGFGRPCGTTVVRFQNRDQIEVRTNYGTWQFMLDPDTGAPLGRLGPTCSG